MLLTGFQGATKTTIDDALIDHKLPKNVSRFVPYFFLHAAIPFWSNGNETVRAWVTALVDVYAVLIAILIIRSLLRAFRQQLQKAETI
jgi:miniconductance mechanosensitive channel